MTPQEIKNLFSTIEQDHELVAAQMGLLKRITTTVLDTEGRDYDQALESLHEIERFMAGKLLPHFQEEEDGLFQLFRDELPGGPRLVAELEAEHSELRTQHEQFRAELALLNYLDESRHPVLLHLCSMSWQMADLLAKHAEKERQAMNDCVKRLLATGTAAEPTKSHSEQAARCS